MSSAAPASPLPSRLSGVLLSVVALIHLLPVSGVLGAERLSARYGLDASAPDLQILLRHRAVLFGLLGTFLLLAAFRPGLRGLGLVAGWVSVLSFLVLAAGVGGYNAQVQRVVVADVIAAVCLAGSSFLEWRARSHPAQPGR